MQTAKTKYVDWLPDDGMPVSIGDCVYAVGDGEPWEVQRFGLKEVGGDRAFRWVDIPDQPIVFVGWQGEARRRNEVLHLAAYIVSLEEKLTNARARLSALES